MSQADFSCAICYDAAADPVVSRCGHLFCWRCLERWLRRPGAAPMCPVCRGRVDENVPGDIIPLYGRGKGPAAGSTRPSVQPEPPRPAADRAPPPPQRRDRGHSMAWGLSTPFFLLGGNMIAVLGVIAFFFVCQLTPWPEWVEWARERLNSAMGRESAETPGGEQQQQQQQPPRQRQEQQHQQEREREHQQQANVGEGGNVQVQQSLFKHIALFCVFVFFISCIVNDF